MITAEQLQELRAELERIERKLGELIASATDTITYTYQDAQGVEHSDSMTVRIPALPEGWEWGYPPSWHDPDYPLPPLRYPIAHHTKSESTVSAVDGQLYARGEYAPLEVVRAVLERFGGSGDAQT